MSVGMEHLLGEVLPTGASTRVLGTLNPDRDVALVVKVPMEDVPDPTVRERLRHEHTMLAQIFLPFGQVGNRSASEGTGLGLSISHKFVELMGGWLGVPTVLSLRFLATASPSSVSTDHRLQPMALIRGPSALPVLDPRPKLPAENAQRPFRTISLLPHQELRTNMIRI